MPARLLAVTFDVHDPAHVARFWADVLDREIVEDAAALLVPGDDTQVGLRFAAATSEKVGQNRMHLHLTSTTPGHQQETVARAVELGARHIDVGQGADSGFVVLADPGDNELCVIEAGNRYLAGTGFLGEVACDGTRDVGLFWRDALAWPLVWDQDEETAIQSPLGGTKVAWGGPPLALHEGRNRQRFELVATDLDAEVERLVALGATRLEVDDDGRVELTDPDGTEFSVREDRR